MDSAGFPSGGKVQLELEFYLPPPPPPATLGEKKHFARESEQQVLFKRPPILTSLSGAFRFFYALSHPQTQALGCNLDLEALAIGVLGRTVMRTELD